MQVSDMNGSFYSEAKNQGYINENGYCSGLNSTFGLVKASTYPQPVYHARPNIDASEAQAAQNGLMSRQVKYVSRNYDHSRTLLYILLGISIFFAAFNLSTLCTLHNKAQDVEYMYFMALLTAGYIIFILLDVGSFVLLRCRSIKQTIYAAYSIVTTFAIQLLPVYFKCTIRNQISDGEYDANLDAEIC